MYKKASQNLQWAASNKKGEVHLDYSTFKKQGDIDEAKQKLVAEKMRCEHEISLLNFEIKKAASMARGSGMFLRQKQWDDMHNKKEELLALKAFTEQRLGDLKRIRLSFRDSEDRAFAQNFLKMAKMMLADDVYLRICAATSHSFPEQQLKDETRTD